MTAPTIQPGDVVRNEGVPFVRGTHVLLCIGHLRGRPFFLNRYCKIIWFLHGYEELRKVGRVDLGPWHEAIEQVEKE